MANSCASLDTTWSHLPAPAPAPWPYAAWFSPAAAAFENDALATALARASASPSSPTPSSSTTTTSSASELSCTPYDAPALPAVSCRPASAAAAARHCTGRVSKRKPRVSRRPQTTYITADPANFRRMVQEITGYALPGAERASAVPAPPRPDPLAFVLPTLDTSACFLLDQGQAPSLPQQRWEDKTSGGAAAATAMPAMADDSSLRLMQELEAMMSAPPAVSSFPTLESWGMI
uniref:VQ domain-containing protein n=1 Tax=Triticum urartu TaxID=4572 RepID=A0A8R7TTZ1_TRIUA